MKISETEDGSYTIFSEQANQTYHSHFGAMTESKYIFIDKALNFKLETMSSKAKVRVLEIGFGTGLNALLAERFAEQNVVDVEYHTIELYPIAEDVCQSLDYGSILGCQSVFYALHKAEWGGAANQISDRFILKKYRADITVQLESMAVEASFAGFFDVIFFDAFSPDAQPELWTMDIFRNIYSLAGSKGVLTTYCSKGDVRRNMISAGFKVEKLQGPPGKRHILRAVKE